MRIGGGALIAPVRVNAARQYSDCCTLAHKPLRARTRAPRLRCAGSRTYNTTALESEADGVPATTGMTNSNISSLPSNNAQNGWGAAISATRHDSKRSAACSAAR